MGAPAESIDLFPSDDSTMELSLLGISVPLSSFPNIVVGTIPPRRA
jgi:hypothetical protein